MSFKHGEDWQLNHKIKEFLHKIGRKRLKTTKTNAAIKCESQSVGNHLSSLLGLSFQITWNNDQVSPR